MTPDNSNQPDLDWSQVKETVKLLTASITQVECSMGHGDTSVNKLTESFTSMVAHVNAITKVLNDLDDSDKKEQAMDHCLATSQPTNPNIDYGFSVL
jgi:hypothetical protein